MCITAPEYGSLPSPHFHDNQQCMDSYHHSFIKFHLYTSTELGRLLVTWAYSTPLTTESVQSPYLLNLHLMAMHVCGHDVAFSQHTSDIASALKFIVGRQNVTHVGTQLHLMWHASVATNGVEQLQYVSTAWIHHYCQWRWWGVVCMVVASWM